MAGLHKVMELAGEEEEEEEERRCDAADCLSESALKCTIAR